MAQAGQGDAANLLKPALARGELRTIAATTWAEYKKYFEKDAALARRFQVVKVEEPDEAAGHRHDARPRRHAGDSTTTSAYLNEAIVDAVRLSSRYISGRQLPDKAMSLLDTTCARIGLSRTATPSAIEDCRRQIEQIERRAERDPAARSRDGRGPSRSDSDELAAERARRGGATLAEQGDAVDAGTGSWWSTIVELRREGFQLAFEAPRPDDETVAPARSCEAPRGRAACSCRARSPLVHVDVNSQAIAKPSRPGPASLWAG